MGSLGCAAYIVLPIQGNQKGALKLRIDVAPCRLLMLFAILSQINVARTVDLLLRGNNRQSMNEILNKVLVLKSSEFWRDTLLAASIPCTVIENVKSIADSKLSDEYRAFSSVRTASGRDMRFVRNPIADPEFIETAAPALGQHTAEILAVLELT